MGSPRRCTPAPGALLLLLALAGCGHEVPWSGRDDRPPPRPMAASTVDPYYAAPGAPAPARVVSQVRTRSYDRVRLRLPARYAPGAPEEARREIRMTWWRPRHRHDPRPAVLLSPILGSGTAFMDEFAVRFVAQGWHALLIDRPEIEYDPRRPLSQVEDRLRTAVSRQVQALDWLLTRPEVDPARLATFGISAGGIQGVLVAGADPRYVAHVFGLAGGPLSDVFLDTDERRLVRLACRARIRERLDAAGLRARLAAEIRTDPVALAARVPPEQVLLVLARRDTTVPFASGLRLRAALGEPATVVLPWNHYLSVFSLPATRARVVAFLGARFDAVAEAPTPRDGRPDLVPGSDPPARGRPAAAPRGGP